MLLYLLRHADALDANDDAARPLSPKGLRQVESVATFLAQSDAFEPREIWHSPLVRAKDTAFRLARALRSNARLIETAGLRPEDDPAAIARRLADGPEALALVGHEPHLSALASLLITGRPSPPVVVFEKCAVLALEGPVDHWAVRWHVTPHLLGSPLGARASGPPV